MNNKDQYALQFDFIFSCLCRYMDLEYVHDDGECKFKLNGGLQDGGVDRFKWCYTLLHHHSGLKWDAKRNDYIKIRAGQPGLIYNETDE